MSDSPSVTLTSTAAVSRWRRRWVVDLAIALALMAASGMWAASFWNEWTARGGRGVFYQTYFEPAVMIACGKGFVISHPQPKPLEDFLFERVDRFDCKDIPADNPLDTRFLYQGAWRYLLTTVGWAWWLLGISWKSLGPFVGLWYGVVIALAYGVFRIGVGRVAAVTASALLTVSSMQLLNMPHLRDFAKAPFTIALVLILAALVTRPVTRRTVLLLSLTYGIVLGIGYGFRTDFLINLPLLPIVLFVFLGAGLWQRVPLKAAGVVVFMLAFFITSWPITRFVYASGGCQWHVTLLGLQSPFDEYLGIRPAPYDFGHAYSDSYIDRTINGFRWRHTPDVPQMDFCSHQYDAESGQYLSLLVKEFPADFIARAYASALQVLELPFRAIPAPMPDWHSRLYAARADLLANHPQWGLRAALLAVLIVSSGSLRLGAALLFLLAYLGGYPAVQFQERHYFHLEFIGWWTMAFVVDRAITALLALRHGFPSVKAWYMPAARVAMFAGIALFAAVGALSVARWYQAGNVRALLRSYAAAAKIPIESPSQPLAGIPPTAWPQLLEVNLNPAACISAPKVTFKYSESPSVDFTRTVQISRRAGRGGITRIYQPVFDHFIGLEISDSTPGCFVSASRVSDLTTFPILLGATLPTHWESDASLYQRLAEWEPDPDLRRFEPLPDPQLWSVGAGHSKSWTLFGPTRVDGDASESGYQLTSPVIQVAPGQHVAVRVDVSQRRGHVCLGVLDANAQKWIASATSTGTEVRFVVDQTGGFMVAVVNCNVGKGFAASRFTIGRAEFTLEQPGEEPSQD